VSCCAVGTCENPACYLCLTVAKLPQPRFKGRDGRDGEKATRDGQPKLAGERKRKDIMFRKLHRDGPHRVNA
jgi:hypothetical protein